MTTIGKPGSRPTSLVKQEPVKQQTAKEPRPNQVKAAVDQRMRDGFDAGPRTTGTASRPTREARPNLDGEGARPPGGPGASVGKAAGAAADAIKKALAGTGPQVSTNASGQTVVDLGAGNNSATVKQNTDGGLTITSGSDTVTLTAEQSRNAVIQGGEGDDSITVDDSVTHNLTLDGGAGNDKLTGGKGNDKLVGGAGNDTLIGRDGNDAVSAGDGDDYVEGGAGNDVVAGGAGRDVLYGLDGNDLMLGGGDRDYIDGGAGNDVALGGAGDDQVLGGRGNDYLSGGAGNDAVAGGAGKDTVRGNAGTDKLYVEENETTDGPQTERTLVDMTDADQRGRSITVSGNADFQARVQSDLDAMRSLPSGQSLLATMDNSGKTTTIKPTAGGNSAAPDNRADAWFNADGTPGKGTNGTVNYNTTRTSLGSEEWMTRPPSVALFHEMVHASDYNNGTLALGEKNGTNNRETSAVGLPIDLDQNPATPDVVQPGRPGENVFRDDLNLPTRPRY